MYNDLFSIGPLTIHGYGLMIGIGFIAALLVGSYRAKKRGLNSDFLFNLAILCLIFGMIGAKLLYMLTVIDKIIADPADILSLSSGFVVYGGIIVGILTGMIYCKIKGKVFRNYFDIVMPSISIAQGFGRIGCFLAGCCYGKETNAWYGITFNHSDYAPNGISLIPTQLISSIGNFIIAGLLILIARKQKKPGFIAGLYLVFYGVGRFFVEMLRGDIERGNIGSLSTSQFISIFIVLIGIIYIIYILKFTDMPESIAENIEAPAKDTAETVENNTVENNENNTVNNAADNDDSKDIAENNGNAEDSTQNNISDNTVKDEDTDSNIHNLSGENNDTPLESDISESAEVNCNTETAEIFDEDIRTE